MLTLLATLWQSDSAFPNGAFAFSNGIEGLEELGERLDGVRLATTLTSSLIHRWAGMDAIAVLLAFAASENLAGLAEIDRRLEAATLPAPQRSGSRRNGLAFLTSHARIGTVGAAALKTAVDARQLLGHLPVMQGTLWRRCGLDETSALAASAYGTASAMTSAAVRLSLVGAVDAQRALAATLPVIAGLVEEIHARAPVSVDDFASTSPLLDIATMRHATSEVRLFSN